MVTDVVPLLLLVTRVLDDLEIPYVIGGSLASSQHGEVRATNDVDLMLDLALQQVGAFVAALKPAFDIWEDTVMAAVEGGHAFGALHVEWLFKVDFYPAGRSLLDERTMSRRQAFRLAAEPSRDIYFSSPEDTILRKLDWYRASGAVLDRQWRDVLGILKLQAGRLDMPYLRSTAEELELRDLLDRCCQEAGLAP